MSDQLIIQVDDAKAQAWFGQLLERGADLSGLMREIGELLLGSTQARFDTSTAPDGTPWTPLSQSAFEKMASDDRNLTKSGRLNARGAAAISGRRPLLNTGTLRNQIAPVSGPNWVEIVASAKQARWHQEGTRPYVIKPKNKKALAWAGGPGPRKAVHHPGLPARPFIGLSQADEQGIDRLSVAWLELG